MERSSGNFDTAVVERAEVVQVRKQRTKCRDFQKKTIERGFRSSWVRTSEVLLYQSSQLSPSVYESCLTEVAAEMVAVVAVVTATATRTATAELAAGVAASVVVARAVAVVAAGAAKAAKAAFIIIANRK